MRKPEIIMCPGPVKVSPEVLLAQSQPMVYHRGPGYGALLSAVTDGMKKIFKTSNDVLSFTCSGTGGMECAVANSFARGDEVLVVDVGNFGKRFFDIATGYGLKAVRMEYEWGKVAVPEEVAQTLAANPGVKGVLMQQSETSTGVMNDVEAIAKAIRGVSKDVLIIVDAISGLGAAELKTDEWDLDVVIAGSQKAMAMSPGLAFLAVSDRAWKANERSDLPKYYFSWKKTKEALSRPNPEHPFTPAVCLFQGMKTAIEIYLEEGSEAALARHKLNSEAVKAGAKALGLEIYGEHPERGTAVTAIKVPEGIDGKAVSSTVRKRFGIVIAGGQGKLAGKVFRIGHLGWVDKMDILQVLSAVEMALRELGYPAKLGQGVAAAQGVYVAAEKPKA